MGEVPLFVYGTLRPGSGHAMSRWLAARAWYLGPAEVQGRLLRISYYPGLVPGAGRVRGDLYLISPALWPELDAFEALRGLPDDEYCRELWPQRQGAVAQAWVYRYQGSGEGLVEVAGGDWLRAGV